MAIIKRIGYNADNDKLNVGLHDESFSIDLSQEDNATLKTHVLAVFATIEENMSEETIANINTKLNAKKNIAIQTKGSAQEVIDDIENKLIT